MTNTPTQDDLNAVLLKTIQEFVVDELVANKDQRIDLSNRLTGSGSMIIDITNRQKQKKVIIVYQGDQLIMTPKARRRINEGTRYIPSYIEINANVRHYTYGNAEYLKSIEHGYSNSVLKTIMSHLSRELLNDTGYPITPEERIQAKAGKIGITENTYLVDHSSDVTPADTEYYRIVSINKDNCYDKEDRVTLFIADAFNYSSFLGGRESVLYEMPNDDSPKVGDANSGDLNVGDYVVVYHASGGDSRKENNRKIVRFVPPPTFTRWFKT